MPRVLFVRVMLPPLQTHQQGKREHEGTGDVCHSSIGTLPAMLLWRRTEVSHSRYKAMLSLEAYISFIKIALFLRNYSTPLLLPFIQLYLCSYWERCRYKGYTLVFLVFQMSTPELFCYHWFWRTNLIY